MAVIKACSDDNRSVALDVIREAVAKNPLAAAPAALQAPIWRVWTCHQHLFPTPLPVAGAVGVWVREFGLREDDAASILARLLHPSQMGEFRFASDLMTRLAAEASAAIDRRRNEDEVSARRAGVSSPETRAEVRRLLDGFGVEPGE